ncbi:MAG: transposase [Victivallales bacterium]|nr:transposase [Victivallales bacterium]
MNVLLTALLQVLKRGDAVGKTERGKSSKIMVVGDAHGLPVAAHVASASSHEEETLNSSWLARCPDKLIGDKAYDSDLADEKLMTEKGIELIAPNRVNRKIKTQDGRKFLFF